MALRVVGQMVAHHLLPMKTSWLANSQHTFDKHFLHPKGNGLLAAIRWVALGLFGLASNMRTCSTRFGHIQVDFRVEVHSRSIGIGRATHMTWIVTPSSISLTHSTCRSCRL